MSSTFKWEYDDYEFDNRVSNLMWTICGDYRAKMSKDEKHFKGSKEVALYQGITAGGRRKYLDWPLINTYFSSRIKEGFKKENLLPLIHMGSDLFAVEQMIKERPGITDLRREAFLEILKIKEPPISSSFIQRLDFLLCHRLSEKDYTESPSLLSLYDAVYSLKNKEDTLDFLKSIDAIYCDFFNITPNFSFDGLDLFNSTTKTTDVESEIEALVNDFIKHSKTSDEKQSLGEIADAQVLVLDSSSIENIQKQVNHYYGDSFLSDHETKKMQNRLCRGVHLDCKLHFTNGILRSHCDSSFQKKYAQRDKATNLEAFEKNYTVYRRNISRLRDGLIRTLISERSPYTYHCMDGTIVPSRVWRVGRSPFPKIFEKTQSNDKGNFVVDLLIDASNSQQNREPMVSIQAYTIAQALSEASIPCRVSGFSSFMDYTILKRFRDYDDSQNQNFNIFEYSCVGANRDGLAIKGICHHLYQRQEENKILIVLSDGKPNDIKLVPKENANPFRGEFAYTGGLAIGDTAKEIRIARQHGIMVLGVFTGNKFDLFAEKLIYGKDFIYSQNIHHFSDVVMSYLKRIICQ